MSPPSRDHRARGRRASPGCSGRRSTASSTMVTNIMPDQSGGDLLEGGVLVEPHHDEPGEAHHHRPPGEADLREERGERQRRGGHRRGAVDEAPDDDVRPEVPGRPAAERAPALEDRVAGGQRVAPGALDEHDLQDDADDHRPEQAVAVARPGHQRRHHVGGADAGRGDDEARSDDLPARRQAQIVVDPAGVPRLAPVVPGNHQLSPCPVKSLSTSTAFRPPKAKAFDIAA